MTQKLEGSLPSRNMKQKSKKQGRLGGSVGQASDFGSGHDLTVHEFEPRVRLCADSSGPGACFRFCVSLSLCPSPAHTLSLSQKKHWGAWVAQSVKHLDFSSGHDLTVREFEPHVGLWADGSEPGACFRFCVSPSLCPSPIHALSLSVPKIKKRYKKN